MNSMHVDLTLTNVVLPVPPSPTGYKSTSRGRDRKRVEYRVECEEWKDRNTDEKKGCLCQYNEIAELLNIGRTKNEFECWDLAGELISHNKCLSIGWR
jgi:hypothetical protein